MAAASKSGVDIALTEAAALLLPLRRLDSASAAIGLLRELGWQVPAASALQRGLPSVADAVGGEDGLVADVKALAEAASGDDYAELLTSVASTVKSVVSLILDADGLRNELQHELAAFPAFLTESNIASEELPRRLIDYLIVKHLEVRSPPLFASLALLGIVEIEQKEAKASWEPDVRGGTYSLRRVHWDRIPTLFTDPLALANELYQWNQPGQFNAALSLQRLERVFHGFMLPGGLYPPSPAVAELLRLTTGDRELRIPLFQASDWPESHAEAGLSVAPIRTTATEPGLADGLALLPYLIGGLELQIPLGDHWAATIGGSLEVESGISLSIRPSHNLAIDVGLLTPPPDEVSGRIEVGIQRRTPKDTLIILFGSEDASLLGLRSVGLALLASLADGETEIAGELQIEGLTITIDTADGDGFLHKLLSGIKVDSVVDLTIGWSNKDGLYFRGSGALEVTIAIHKKLGPIYFDSAHVGVTVDGGFELILAATLSAELGPVNASVNRIGLRLPIGLPADGRGNFGPLHVEAPRFQPPTGAGLSLDAGGIVGGGFLEFDDANKRYAGILGLTFGEIGLVAIGLVTTRMPDGSDGFSLLINIGVTFDPAIQLSMGFTLVGVGGLVGVNRTMDIEVLQTGIRTGVLDSILFPDPATVVENANQIISDMRAVFPPAGGRFVVGPMAKIGYGTPAFITADIGIFIELPDPVRIVLMGQVEALLPEPVSPVITIHLDILGVLDFSKRQLTFQASIHDSHILEEFEITGDSAFLVSWDANPRFALSLGGFHPKFEPPPPPIIFSGLRRLSIAIGSGGSFQLSCTAYNALTPNSLQFGARVDLFASAGGASVQGFLGFEALIYFSPFAFEVWIGASVLIRYEGATLADVRLDFTLSGPGAWSARGNARFKILFFDISVRFNFQWGDAAPSTLPAVDAWAPLRAALAAPGNWSGALPPGIVGAEMFRERASGPGPALVHPAAQIEVRQQIVPLNISLDKISNAPVAGHDRFTITSLEVNESTLATTPIEEFFARGQFVNVSEAQRLSIPSFERLEAGLRTVGAPPRIEGRTEPAAVEYESILLGDKGVAVPQSAPGGSSWAIAERPLQARAEARAAAAGPRARFAVPHQRPKVQCADDRYCVAEASNLRRAALDPSIVADNRNLTRLAADQALAAHRTKNPDATELIVVAEYEIEQAA